MNELAANYSPTPDDHYIFLCNHHSSQMLHKAHPLRHSIKRNSAVVKLVLGYLKMS